MLQHSKRNDNKFVIVDGRNELTLELDRSIELDFGHSLVKPPRQLPQSVRDRARGFESRRGFGLVSCPTPGCIYFLIVKRGQKTALCPRCGKLFWLHNIVPLATTDYVKKLEQLIPRLHGRQSHVLLPHETRDLDRFAAPHHIKLTRLAEGKRAASSCGESAREPHNDEPGVMPRARAAKKELGGSAQREAEPAAHVSPRRDRGGPTWKLADSQIRAERVSVKDSRPGADASPGRARGNSCALRE